MTRQQVYDLIDKERDYQIERWTGEFDDSQWAINDWLVFIERYIKKARDYTGFPVGQMNEIRKIAALAVAAMEYNHTLARK